ncbi:class I SAM-dependent DNA methyltransferase [Algoriphagus halophytocola]|uniref:site-specific DNA-methyltransferase (adenine-specific) n=1 Tax=Algoriphagus halophytocola TaxID=2991499 RepID=A0ABY6MCG4_9BACT|nr:DNA methyltransferase [Algoriphagus sp. TR-M5]UZD21153.1 class I SAM-dependent DNA methyltransferase [Algoriphagus sp. TR-M5]
MNIAQIESNLQNLIKSFSKETFIYDLLLAYALPKASITRLQKGNLNLSKTEGDISWKKKLRFQEEYSADLHLTISELAQSIKHEERFVIVTDYEVFLAIDTKTGEKLDIEIKDLPKHFDFFLPWAGMEKAQHRNENPADVKAAERMAKLFDEIKKDNPVKTEEDSHALNVFLTRLLFCFFAEDTHIFQDGQFTNAISSHTAVDGHDLRSYLESLFEVLNTASKDRKDLPAYLNAFPYVNGGLFKDSFQVPEFSRRSRQLIIDAGEMNWKDINPDIFGSMFQGVIDPDKRGSLGAHYTSVPNIMKVIEPLFLNELKEEFEKAKHNPKKLNELLYRLSKIKIFDPACGSGNFLIIAYKELRRLEIAIIHHLQELQKAASGFNGKSEQLSFIPKAQLSLAASFQVELFSRIQLSQFFGIEIDDFAHEIAQLSLWLAEHQMNVEFYREFGKTSPTLPLKEAGKIVCGNACRLDWEKVCPKKEGDEIYILGNPPYIGGRMQNAHQKKDLSIAYSGFGKAPKVDYISCWFLKSSVFISGVNSKFAFVTTNSINQGEQVSMIWRHILGNSQEIFFAHKGFKWENNAKKNAAVIVSIIGVRNISNEPKYLIEGNLKSTASNISPYLVNAKNTFIEKRSTPISSLNRMEYGNMAIDGGFLILSPPEKKELVASYPQSDKIIRRIYGAQEYLNGVERYCLWIREEDLAESLKIPEVNKRVEQVREKRQNGNDDGVIELAKTPHQFREMKDAENFSLILPTVSSERREYIPIGFIEKGNVIIAPNQVIYDPNPFLLGLLCSKMHMTWMRTTAGRLKTDYRYSSSLVYNTFPFPSISDQRKQEITQCVFRILEERERHSEKTLAQLYDPDKMPEGLREAHRQNDLAIERCYRSRPFESDEERLEYLFKLYEKMIEEEKIKDSLFEKEKKGRKIKN